MLRDTPKDTPLSASNSAAIAAGTIIPPRRGRPKKLGKLKVFTPIVATGKGRGRPKKPACSDGEKEENDEMKRMNKTVKGPVAVRPTRNVCGSETRGRPRKEKVYSDSDSSSFDEKRDYEERRPVGRPPTGAVNLNIVRTGRGQGRPNPIKRPVVSHANSHEGQSARKRGRPSKGGVPYTRTGKPRGRPRIYDRSLRDNEPMKEEINQSDGEIVDASDLVEQNVVKKRGRQGGHVDVQKSEVRRSE